MAEALIQQIPPAAKGKFPTDAAAILAAAHDIGKVSPGFQRKCPKWMTKHKLPALVYETDHAKVSQFSLQEILSTSAVRPWTAIVGAHHGGIKGEKVFPTRVGMVQHDERGAREWHRPSASGALLGEGVFSR